MAFFYTNGLIGLDPKLNIFYRDSHQLSVCHDDNFLFLGINLIVATLKNVNMQNCDLRKAVLAGNILIHQFPLISDSFSSSDR